MKISLAAERTGKRKRRNRSWPAITLTACLAFMAIVGLLLGGTDGVAFVATAGVLWFPGLIGYVLGLRKRQVPLEQLIAEIRDSLVRVEDNMAQPAEQAELAVVRGFPVR
jgi:hypothetical protein